MDEPKYEPGASFRVIVSGGYSSDVVRQAIEAKAGLPVHLKLSLGPVRHIEKPEGGSSIDAPITAIDDPYLDGSFNLPIPAVGNTLYIGYFKEKVA